MFITNNTMIMTEDGSLNASNINSTDKIYTIDGYASFDISKSRQKTNFIKTDLLPTIVVGKGTEILTGRIYLKDNSVFIKNQFFPIDDVKTGDYIVVPKTHYKIDTHINRTLCWLYAKYIVSGYYCTEKQTNKDMIVINPRKMSKKEALRLRRYADISYDLQKMLIIIKNEDIIKLFGKDKKHLIKEVYNLDSHIIEYFLHSIQIENPTSFIKLESKTMAYDLFLFLYSKLNKIMCITEEKDDKQKSFYLREASTETYIIFKNSLYVKINNILEGKEASGLEISNPTNKKVHGVFMLMR